MISAALMSEAKEGSPPLYRYLLTRVWDEARPKACFVMLNPSTADAANDDPTIRRCLGFAKMWGCGALYAVNLFAYRSPDPKQLKMRWNMGHSIVGDLNDATIMATVLMTAASGGPIVAAWGAGGHLADRDEAVCRALIKAGIHIWHLGYTEDGSPRHPLYVPSNRMLQTFEVFA